MTDSLATLHSPDTEAAVLGGLLLRPNLIAATALEVGDFFSPRNQAVYVALRSLDLDGLAVDAMTVSAELRRVGKAESVGGSGDPSAMAYLMDLSLRVPSADNLHAYAADLVRYARKRSALDALGSLVHRLRTDETAEGEDVVLEAIVALQRLDLREPDPTKALGDAMRAELRQIYLDATAQEQGRHVGGMPSGIRRLDAFTGGLPIGVVTLVLGETGHGKSTLAMTFARASLDAGDRPLIFSYEDGHRSFAQRALAQESRVPTQVIARRSFRGSEARDVADFGGKAIGKRRERIAAWRGQSVDELCRTVRRLRSRGPSDGAQSVGRLVVVDYLQAIPRPMRRGISTPEAIGENAAALEDLAAREQIAVVVMSQVNDEPQRREKDHRPQGRDVAGSRDPYKGCKLCLAIYRPAVYDPSADEQAGEILILKNNQGESNRTIDVRLDLATHTIRDATSEAPAAEQRRFGGT